MTDSKPERSTEEELEELVREWEDQAAAWKRAGMDGKAHGMISAVKDVRARTEVDP